jgi:hypothetical protein
VLIKSRAVALIKKKKPPNSDEGNQMEGFRYPKSQSGLHSSTSYKYAKLPLHAKVPSFFSIILPQKALLYHTSPCFHFTLTNKPKTSGTESFALAEKGKVSNL